MKRSRQPTSADFHVHTHLSPCGKPQATAAALISRAREKGIAAIGFADHFTPAPVPGCPFYDRQRIEIVTALRAEIAALAPIVICPLRRSPRARACAPRPS
jgi:PHP family Zn ribbon phosphoesterase